MSKFLIYRSDEDGAVTVDWVVLTAAIVGMGFGIIGVLSNGTSNVGQRLSSNLANEVTVVIQ